MKEKTVPCYECGAPTPPEIPSLWHRKRPTCHECRSKRAKRQHEEYNQRRAFEKGLEARGR